MGILQRFIKLVAGGGRVHRWKGKMASGSEGFGASVATLLRTTRTLGCCMRILNVLVALKILC